MKTSAIAILVAMGSLLIGPDAHAACPQGGTTSAGHNGGGGGAGGNLNFAIPAPLPTPEPGCLSPVGLGFGGTAMTGVIVDDSSTLAAGDTVYQSPVSIVYGPNGTAIGNGAFVGKPIYDASGNLIGAEPVENGTALGAGASVQHHNSTAVGAGAKSTQDNQVVLGKSGQRITAPGVVNNPLTKPVQGVIVTDEDGNLASDGGALQGQVNANTAKNTEQDGRLDDHNTRITANKDKNDEQDGRLDANDVKNGEQDASLASHSFILGTHNDQISALQGLTEQQGRAISANTALLSDHSARLDKHEKGIAMAIALPDLYLNEKERFSIAGNLGFFGDETAIAFGAAARLSETWSLNGGLTSDTEFKEIGGKVGIRAGW